MYGLRPSDHDFPEAGGEKYKGTAKSGRVIEKADYVIMLLDSSKVNKKTPYTFARLTDVNCMVVDKNFSRDLKAGIEAQGVRVV